eukprot:c29112_g1_i1 orf=963-4007(+)
MISRMHLLPQQEHSARKSQRRHQVPGYQHPASASIGQFICSTVLHDIASQLGPELQSSCLSDRLEQVSGHLQGETNTRGFTPVVNAHMIPSVSYNFPTGAELLFAPAKDPRCLYSSASDIASECACSGQSPSQGDFSSQSSVTSIKSTNWGGAGRQLKPANTSSDQGVSLPNGSSRLLSSNVGNNFLAGSCPFEATNNREGNMATYLPGSNVQADAMHTLYLMNPSYAGYSDVSNSGNMVLISPSAGVGQSIPLASSGQQHYIGFTLPPVLAQSPLAQQSPITALANSTIGNQNPSTVFPGRPANNSYNSWTGGVNELSFVPSNDVSQVPESLTRISSVNSGQQSASDVSQYNLKRQSVSVLHEQQTPMLQSEVALGLNVENAQVSSGPGQGLSLSLSPQPPSAIELQPFHMQPTESDISSCPALPHTSSGDNTQRGDRFPNRWVGNLSSFRASSRDGVLGTGYQNSLSSAGLNRQPHMESGSTMGTWSGGFLLNSKYLKVAQQLLDEVVSVGKGIRTSSALKNTRLQSWIGHSSIIDGSFGKSRIFSDTPAKDGAAAASSMPNSTSVCNQNNENITDLTTAERQELQMKKAKLMAMLEEVDRRYQQYYNQMQTVVTSFESTAGFGAAKTYTALALQTISQHFRSLRDAISGQIRITSKTLGEDDPLTQGRGETSRLRFVDQQLRQQRALQQLGMIQQHAWRPQRGLPERSVSVLRAWLFEHFLHPYPKDSDKVMLARQTGLTRSQVSNWFINARVRLWKPMVEEMYLEETKEAEMEATVTADKKPQDEAERIGTQVSMMDATGNGNSRHDERQTITDDKKEVGQEKQISSDYEKDGMRQGVKKARNAIQDSVSLLSPNISMDVDLKSDETQCEDICQQHSKLGNEDRHNRETYNISHNGIVHVESLPGFGSYQNIGGLDTRYPQESLAARYPGNSGVSLTLGLQHCDSISLSEAQQCYFNGTNLARGRRQDMVNETGNYYLNENSVGHIGHEAIGFQNQKHFSRQLLNRNFVG